MRGRPKVLLSDSYEEAWELFERYEDHVLGVISDVEFPHGGALDPRAGLELCSRVGERRPGIRLVLQSSRVENRELAEELGASFLLKGSPVLLQQLRRVLVNRVGFGDFVFRSGAGGVEIAQAQDLRTLAEKIEAAPIASILYHAKRNHFSNWLKARTEFDLAERVRAERVEDHADPEELRARLLGALREHRIERMRTVIAEFDRDRFEPSVSITRMGAGSLGGKARGVAFANRILRASGVHELFPDVDIFVPPTVVLGTQVFDDFLDHEDLRHFGIGDTPDRDIERLFMEAPFPRDAISDLRAFLQFVKYPLAVRSSSLLEDSLSQPFAGVYRTFMIPTTTSSSRCAGTSSRRPSSACTRRPSPSRPRPTCP